jgi:cytochrome b
MNTKTSKSQANWLIDAVLFIGFLLTFFLDLTGVELHQWIGIAVCAIAFYHLWVHWDWVGAVTARFFKRTSGQARLYYMVDACMVVGFLLILFTGLAISTWFALPLNNYADWTNVHAIVSIVTLVVVVLKIAIHGRWIISVAKRYIFAPAMPGTAPRAAQVVTVPSTSRRDFLKLMGVVGLASAIAAASALDSVKDALGQDASTSTTDTATQTTSDNQSSTTQSSSTCTVRCQRRCSYPGHCHRYVDTNQNQRCDMGECV